jgi:hypothetical protein
MDLEVAVSELQGDEKPVSKQDHQVHRKTAHFLLPMHTILLVSSFLWNSIKKLHSFYVHRHGKRWMCDKLVHSGSLLPIRRGSFG